LVTDVKPDPALSPRDARDEKTLISRAKRAVGGAIRHVRDNKFRYAQVLLLVLALHMFHSGMGYAKVSQALTGMLSGAKQYVSGFVPQRWSWFGGKSLAHATASASNTPPGFTIKKQLFDVKNLAPSMKNLALHGYEKVKGGSIIVAKVGHEYVVVGGFNAFIKAKEAGGFVMGKLFEISSVMAAWGVLVQLIAMATGAATTVGQAAGLVQPRAVETSTGSLSRSAAPVRPWKGHKRDPETGELYYVPNEYI
jgi:hypothetical protein